MNLIDKQKFLEERIKKAGKDRIPMNQDERYRDNYLEMVLTAFERDVYEFEKYLSAKDHHQYMYEMDKIETQKIDLIKKYNQIASDQISRDELIRIIVQNEKSTPDRIEELKHMPIQRLNVIMLISHECFKIKK